MTPSLSAQDEPASGTPPRNVQPQIQMKHLRDLMIDLAGYHSCDRLIGKVLTLEGEKAGGKAPATGLLRFTGCKATETDKERDLRIQVTGRGWQWIERKREKLGADFKLAENVKFEVKVELVGTFDAAYDSRRHIVTAWFIPTRPVEVGFEVLGEVEVHTDDLWSSFLGQAAALLMTGPDEQAVETIQQKGSYKFRSKLNRGLTLIVDLCSGRRYVEMGDVPPGKIPQKEGMEEAAGILADKTAVMHGETLIFAGPYTIEKPLSAEVEVKEGASVQAGFACEEQVIRMAEAYLKGEEISSGELVQSKTAAAGQRVQLGSGQEFGCPMMFVLKTDAERTQASHLHYQIQGQESGFQPLMKCPEEVSS